MKKSLFTLSLLLFYISSFAQTDWTPLPYKFNSHIHETYVFGNELYIGGNFTNIDGSTAIHSAKYNGSSMSRNTTTDQGGTGFLSFTEYNGKLMGGGGATVGTGMFAASMVLEWDGSQWGNNEYRLDGSVYQVLGYNDTLFVGSVFTTSTLGFDYAGYYDGISWKQAGGILDSSPSYIVFNNELYAYGTFTTCGANSVKYFAKWKNKDWVQMGAGIRQPVFPVVFQNKLYAFEKVSQSGFQTTLQLLEWNGSDWTAHSTQTVVSDANNLRAITADANNIYIGGDLLQAGNQTVYNSARFDGVSWHSMGNALDTVLVNTLKVYNGDLYAGTATDFNTYKAYMYKFSLSGVSSIQDPITTGKNFYYDYTTSHLVFTENTNGAFNVITCQGTIIMEGNAIADQPVSLSKLNKGVYIVKYYSNSGMESRKIVIN